MTRVIQSLDPELAKLLFRAGQRKVVLLEGEDDHGIFKIWFGEHRDQVEFTVAGERFKVEAQVRLAQQAGFEKVVFGITDRDYIPEEDWSAEPEPGCFCLHRHELENYLLEPKAIQHELAILNSPAEPPTVDEIGTWIKTWAEEGISRTAANWILSARAKTLLTDGGKEPRPTVVRHLADELECSEEEADNLLTQKETQTAKLLETTTGLHTSVEGKRLLRSLKKKSFNRLQEGELRNLLARAVHTTGLVDEVQEILQKKVLG